MVFPWDQHIYTCSKCNTIYQEQVYESLYCISCGDHEYPGKLFGFTGNERRDWHNELQAHDSEWWVIK